MILDTVIGTARVDLMPQLAAVHDVGFFLPRHRNEVNDSLFAVDVGQGRVP
jgi:hypothetical protein